MSTPEEFPYPNPAPLPFPIPDPSKEPEPKFPEPDPDPEKGRPAFPLFPGENPTSLGLTLLTRSWSRCQLETYDYSRSSFRSAAR
jgi:hypothetical protein